jgi:hypothetical protein
MSILVVFLLEILRFGGADIPCPWMRDFLETLESFLTS